MPARIAFDLDGTLADMDAALLALAADLFGDHVRGTADDSGDPSGDPSAGGAANGAMSINDLPVSALALSPRKQQKLWHAVSDIDNFWETLAETEPGIVARLAGVAADRRWEVIFLTKRPPTRGATSQRQTQAWLQRHGFPAPSVYVVPGSRGQIAEALGLDIVVDDRVENCQDVVVESHARAMLVWRGDEQRIPDSARRLGIEFVPSVGACLDRLTAPRASHVPRPGLARRVKRLLGISADSKS